MVRAVQHTHQHLYAKDNETLLKRMRRIEGQARGVQRMIEADRYCPEIIQQLTAMSRAIKAVSLLLLQDHIEGCVADEIKHNHGGEMIPELVGVIRRTMRT